MNTPSARAVTDVTGADRADGEHLAALGAVDPRVEAELLADRRRSLVPDGERARVRAEPEASVHRAEQLVEHHRHHAAVHRAGWTGVGRAERAVPAHALAVEREHDRRRDRVERTDHRAVREEARRVTRGELLAVGVRGPQRVLPRDAVDLMRREQLGRLPDERGGLLERVERRVGHALGRDEPARGVDQGFGGRRMRHLGRGAVGGVHRSGRLRSRLRAGVVQRQNISFPS